MHQEQIATPDQQQRDQALDIAQSWIVEAPAGSGKTGLLIQRFLKLLAYAEIEKPEEILAITFTRKATAEMAHRISEALDAASRNAPLQRGDSFERTTRDLANAVLKRNAERGWQLREQPQRLKIRTIDSICAEIANGLPILSGLGARLEPVEDATELYHEAARRTLNELGSANALLQNALTTLLLHRDGNLNDCEQLLAEMLRWRDQWGRLVPLGQELSEEALEAVVKPRLENALRQCIQPSLDHVLQLFPSDALQQLSELTHHAAQLLEEMQKPSKIQAWLSRIDLPTSEVDDLEAWRGIVHQLLTENEWRKPNGINIKLGFEPKSAELAAMKALLTDLGTNEPLREALAKVKTLPPAEYPQEQWHVAKALFRLLQWSLIHLKLLFAEMQQCDFTELALAAQTALEQDNGMDDLASAIGTRIRHLLVDEMQDTSVSQYELLKQLTAGWDGHSQTIFLVGDPKQSIYLFRQARVELFRQTAHEGLGDIHPKMLQLTANFRSQARLVHQFNQDFARIFPAPTENEDGIPFTEAAPTRVEKANTIQWHVRTYEAEKFSSEAKELKKRLIEEEAQEILSILHHHYNTAAESQSAPPKIAILVRARKHLADIADALRRDGSIPFRAVEIESLGERQEVLDALSLTRALLHPADRVAWLSILRAPWCGLTLADLHTLTGNDEKSFTQHPLSHLIEERLAFLPEDAQQRLSRVLHVLKAAEEQRDRIALSQWVERTWHALGGSACVDTQGRANVQAYFQLLEKCEVECQQRGEPVHAHLLKEKLKGLYAESLVEERHAVELMTIHKAKGLEWDVVIVPALERQSGNNKQNLLAWLELPRIATESDDADTLALLAPIQGKGEKSGTLNQWIRNLQNQRERDELQRVYYVACTRAKDELHLFASARKTNSGHEKHDSSLLETAWPIAEEHFLRLEENIETNLPQANLLAMPSQRHSVSAVVTSLAAASASSDNTLRRLPLDFRASQANNIPTPSGPLRRSSAEGIPSEPPQAAFLRPQGTLAARALGTAVHAFLEKLATHFASSGTTENALTMIDGWKPRIDAFLRAKGVPPPQVEQLARQTLQALANTLQDPLGRWILDPHPEAQSEAPMQAHIPEAQRDHLLSVRIDRQFRAGAEPRSRGEDCWWIVDYKTTEYPGDGIEAFLAREKMSHGPQLSTYAQIKQAEQGSAIPIHLALYYPLIKKFLWWKYDSSTEPAESYAP
ncbi:MAG: UvrD-helicase domain-containing protein [Acidobacteriaceae bacterium]